MLTTYISSQTIDPLIDQFIVSIVIFVVTNTIVTLQAKHNEKMLSLYKLIQKSSPSNISLPSPTPPADSKVLPKLILPIETLKTER